MLLLSARCGPLLCGRRKSAGPRKNAAARQHRPAVTFPSADAFFIQQAFQLVRAPMTQRTHAVSGTPVAHYKWKTQPVAVQDRPILNSFYSLGGPVNHP